MTAIFTNRWVQLALALGLAMFFFWRWTGALEEIGSLKARQDVVVKANGTNQQTISTLETALKELVLDRAADAKQRDQVMATRDKELQAAQRAAAQARRERDAIFTSTPGCTQLARMDITALCPVLGQRLRDRSRGGGDPDGGDPG